MCYNPCIPKWSRRLVVRTPGFHPGNRGFDSHRDHHFLFLEKALLGIFYVFVLGLPVWVFFRVFALICCFCHTVVRSKYLLLFIPDFSLMNTLDVKAD